MMGVSIMRWLIRLICLVVGLALIYALSVGPVAVLKHQGFISKATYNAFYSPLEKVAEMPVAGPILKAYYRWWRPHEHK